MSERLIGGVLVGDADKSVGVGAVNTVQGDRGGDNSALGTSGGDGVGAATGDGGLAGKAGGEHCLGWGAEMEGVV